MPNLFHLFLLSLLGSVIALAGGVIFLYNKKWSAVLEKNSIPFAAGVLITVSLLGLAPEALDHLGEQALWIILISFFGAYFFEHFLFNIHHHEDDHHNKSYKSSVPIVLVGDTIHNFIDGIAIGASFLVNPGLGLITAFSTFLHEVPHEIGDFGILLKAGWKRKNILLVNIISASTTIIGAFLIFFLSEYVTNIGSLLAVASGIFLYLGAIDFLPHATEGYTSKIKAIIPLILGIVVMVATLLAVPHSDENAKETEKQEQRNEIILN